VNYKFPRPVFLTLSKGIYPLRLQDNRLDIPTFLALEQVVRRRYLLVQVKSRSAVIGHHCGLIMIGIPYLSVHWLNHLWFVVRAVLLGIFLCRRRPVDVLEASEPTGGGLAAAILKIVTGKPLVLHLQGNTLYMPLDFFSRWRVTISRQVTVWVASQADWIRCVSQHLAGLVKKAGIDERKITLVPSRCDVSRFSPELRVIRPEWRTRLGVNHSSLILFTGTLWLEKGVLYLTQAIRLLIDRGYDVKLAFVGSGPQEGELRTSISNLGLEDKAMLCGRVPHSEIPFYLAAADVFALPSLDEGLPRSVLEAMSMKLPVVASNVGGIPELIEDGKTGILVRPADPNSLAAGVERILANPSFAEMLGNHARDFVIKNHSFENSMDIYRSFLKKVIASCE
jgi:glycosyltransferase involved in cell wall biosynthesis